LLGSVLVELERLFLHGSLSLSIIGLRFSNIMTPEAYAKFPSFDEDARLRKWNLWAYIDARDAAQAVRLALESPLKGAEIFIIANADSVMSRPNDELLDEVYPGVPRKRSFGPTETLLSIDKAKAMLGYEPKFGWRGSSARSTRARPWVRAWTRRRAGPSSRRPTHRSEICTANRSMREN
jgi:nucleoside-diphosphate-sugar epimerase